MSSSNEAWVWDVDRDLLNSERAWVDIDYESSTTEAAKFWNLTEPAQDDGKLVYSVSEARLKKLQRNDYFPSNHSFPAITSSMRQAIERVCNSDEIAFHPCEIRSKGKLMIEAWNLYPLRLVECIDLSASEAEWDEFLKDEIRINEAKKVLFKSNCLGGLNIARLRESPSWIVVSKTLKCAIEEHNTRGIRFVLSVDSRIGKDIQSLIKYQ